MPLLTDCLLMQRIAPAPGSGEYSLVAMRMEPGMLGVGCPDTTIQ